jgi:RNA polymerase sigma-70 factor (ECF subfamily)
MTLPPSRASRLATVSDEELVERFRAGDRPAFDAVVTRYQDRVFAMCLRWLGERESAEDVAQEVFVALFRSLHDFRGDARLSTYVFRCTVNHCRNRRTHRGRRGWGRHDAIDDTRELAADSPGTDGGVHASEARRLVDAGLAQLDDDLRAVVLLRDLQDLDYDEIAAVLDVPRGTVKSRLHRARSELAAAIARHTARGPR